MASLVTGTIGPGDWRTTEKQRQPSFNQGRRRENVGGVTGGAIDLSTVPAKVKRHPKAQTQKPMGKQARRTQRRARRAGGLGL